MARIGLEPKIRPKMGGLCNFFTGGGFLLRRSPCSHHRKSIIPSEWPNGLNWLRAGNWPEDGWAVQLVYGGWTPAAMLSLFTSPQAHYPTRMARIGFEPGIRPKMGRLCNSFTGGGLPLRCSPLPTSAQAHYSTRMARIGFEPGIRTKMGRLCNFFTGGGLLLRRSPCSHHHKSIIPPEWPELAWSQKFARRWVGCAISLRGVDSCCDALLAHITASPLSHPNGRMA